MAKSATQITKYKSAVTIVTADVANSWYGGLYGSSEASGLDAADPLVAGHVHDGQHLDGHAQKINLVSHVTNQLRNVNLGTDAVDKRTVNKFETQSDAIPEYEVIDSVTYYYLDLSDLRGELVPPFEHSPILNVVRYNEALGPDNATTDFVINAPALDYDASYPTRVLFDRSSVAFRVGTTSGVAWDAANRGLNSFGWGVDTYAQGTLSFVGGSSNQVDATSSSSSILNGTSNTILSSSSKSLIGTGENNIIQDSTSSVIGAGDGNSIVSSDFSTIVNGDGNVIESGSDYTTLIGLDNVAGDSHMLGIGSYGEAQNPYSFYISHLPFTGANGQRGQAQYQVTLGAAQVVSSGSPTNIVSHFIGADDFSLHVEVDYTCYKVSAGVERAAMGKYVAHVFDSSGAGNYTITNIAGPSYQDTTTLAGTLTPSLIMSGVGGTLTFRVEFSSSTDLTSHVAATMKITKVWNDGTDI